MPGPHIAIILPVYNETPQIAHVFQTVAEFAEQHPQFHFLFVDDGSSDATPALIKQWLEEKHLPRLELLALSVNGGKGRAIHRGAEHVRRFELVCFTDGDLAYSLDHLLLLADALTLSDVVIGSRSLVESGQKNIRFTRKLMGWVFNKFARIILFLPYRDTQAGLKGFRQEAAQRIFSRQQLTDFSFDVELVYLARRYRYRIAEIPARVSEAHSYKISSVKLLRDPWRMFMALWRVRINAWRGLYA